MKLTERRLNRIVKEEIESLKEDRLYHRTHERGFLENLEENGLQVEKNIYSHSPSKIVGDKYLYYVVDSDEEKKEKESEYTDKTYEKRIIEFTISVHEKGTGITGMFRNTEKDRFTVKGKVGSDIAERFMKKFKRYER